MSIKVLCLFPRFYIGGVSKALSFVANCCDSEGWDVYCISMTSEPETIQLNKDIHRIVIDIREDCTGIKKMFWRAVFMIRLRLKIRAIQPDIIVVFRADLLKAILYATRRMNVPIIGSERGDPRIYGAKLEEYRRFFNRCSTVVFQTEEARDVFQLRRKSVIIPNPSVLRVNQAQTFIQREGKNIVSAGRLSKEKNFDGLINAFAMSKEQLGDSKLIIYGDGPEKGRLEAKVKELQLTDRVLLPGNVKDFTLEFDGAGVFVLNSLHEGMPNALIEAMIAGYACIATDCSGGPLWLSDNGRRVRLVPVTNDDALGKAIIDVVNNDAVASELRFNAREIIRIMDPDRIKQLWLSLIKDTIREKKNEKNCSLFFGRYI